MLTVESRQGNFSSKMYGAYLAEQRQVVSHGAPIAESFLAWHRWRQFDSDAGEVVYRGGRHQQASTATFVVACRYWYELTDGYWYQQDLLPVGRHLTSMQNFVGMLREIMDWRASNLVGL